MQNKISLLFLVALLLTGLNESFGHAGKKPGDAKGVDKTLVADCIPSSAFAYLDINNVRARINTGGDMWWDLQGDAQYYIPKSTYITSLFSGAIWIGGLDDAGNLKVAAQQYRGEGVDFFTGPVSIDGSATTDASTCDEWDKIFVLYRAQVEDFRTAFSIDPTLSGYIVPDFIKNYPAHGDLSKGQSYYLAPFYDMDHDGFYDYKKGDYPYYDFENALCPNNQPWGMPATPTMEGNGVLADQVLRGDQTLWWIFNDKGNIHGDSKGEAIGLEIRAQAYAYATYDELNNATFYAYEIINRSSSRLNEVWFGQYVDVDLGDAWDDYVGSDVERGLGYCYNGKDPDGNGGLYDYGAQPPAVGVDFYQGPYMDADGIDNPKYDIGGNQLCDVSINGQNFGDGIIDNERFGMGKFIYFNCGGGFEPMGCPTIATQYYNFLQAIWGDDQHMTYWGNAHPMAGGVGPNCSFMFPGNSDPCNYGTNGIDPSSFYPGESWTEPQAGNAPYNRRFTQSTGPFTLEPGEVNYITVGIPWARATSGGPMASVELLKLVDDKFQALFDHCFEILEGPDAPDLSIQELDRELILYISNRKGLSNNYSTTPEDFVEVDHSIVYPDTMPLGSRGDSAYRFEGYQIFQLKDANVTMAEIKDPDKARLVAQCDRKNGVSKLVNYYFDHELGAAVPVEEVNGADAGIVHSFRIFEDMFATSDKRLVNFKHYYYLAISYAYNSYAPYNQMDPLALTGQKLPYLAGCKSSTGVITSQAGIPHIPSPEAGGTITHAEYGVIPMITRLEGQGNGGVVADLTQETIDQIHANYWAGNLEYKYNKGPVNIKVADPLNLVAADYILRFDPPTNGAIDQCNWTLSDPANGRSWTSEATIKAGYEQLLMDIGLSIQVNQPVVPGFNLPTNNGFLEATIDFADSTKQWLSGVPDFDSYAPFNWIRGGQYDDVANAEFSDFDPGTAASPKWLDPTEVYEKVLSGTWAPYALASYSENGPAFKLLTIYSSRAAIMGNLASIDLYITADQSKWSRCPVFEMCENTTLAEGGVTKLDLRSESTDGVQGMGWFPGYAINIETGERLNIAFGEDTWLQSENGGDMKWNPTQGMISEMGEVLLGGKHWVYIFGHNRDSITPTYGRIDCPAYDGGAWIKEAMEKTTYHDRQKQFVFKDVMWVGAPVTTFTGAWDPTNIPCDVKIRLRVSKPYKRFYSTKACGPVSPTNNNYPLYGFSTKDMSVVTQSQMAAVGSLQLINVVPNPYFAYSGYEATQNETKVKITNLPQQCVISIYAINGTLIRQFNKNDGLTYLDWDLRSQEDIPISGGMYLIYVKAEGIGERVVTFFGSMRPSGTDSF